MSKTYKGSLSLEWYNKQQAILLRNDEDIKIDTDIPAPKINWVNKDEALFYEIDSQEGTGLTPYWVNSNDIRVKEARPLILQKVFKAAAKNKPGTIPGMDINWKIDETQKEDLSVDNFLIQGDNLLALNSLKKLMDNRPDKDRVKCIVIDPPFNSEQAFEHYDDNLAHSEWLTMMRDRLIVLRSLLREDGSIWIIIDERESYYLKLLCDEVYGRDCFIGSVIWRTTDNSNNNVTTFSLDHNQILIYSKNPEWKPKFLSDTKRRGHFKNPDNDPRGAWFDGNPVNNPGLRKNLQFDIITPSGKTIKHPPNGWRWSLDTINAKLETGELRFSEDETRLIRRTYLDEAEGLPPTSLWIDLEETGHNRQAKYELKSLFPDVPVTSLFRTPKPEKLIKKILELATDESELVLDCFGGCGTTFAVAHKMNRKWIGVEIGEHSSEFIIPRLKKVMHGNDELEVSKLMEWTGGGSFKFYHVGKSIIDFKKDGTRDFNWILGKKFIEESFLSSYDYNLDNSINLSEGKLFVDEANIPSIGVQTIGTKKRVAVITLNEPKGKRDQLNYDEIFHIYSVIKKKLNPEYINIFTNKGLELAFDSKPDDLEIIKVPHAIFSELEK